VSTGYGTWPGQRRRRGRIVGAAVAVLVVGVAAGVVIGRASAPAAGGLAAGGPAADQGAGPCPAAASQDGAIKAAVCYDALLYRLEGQPEGQVRSQLQAAVANPAAVDRLVTLISRGVPQGGRAAAGVLTVHVDDYGQDSAQVFLWTAVARSAKPGSGDTDAVVDAAWTRDAVEIDWVSGRWALTNVTRTDRTPPSGSTSLDSSWPGAPYALR
jgi:hypothetical protein